MKLLLRLLDLERQFERERRTFADDALDANPAVVLFDNLPTHAQPEAAALDIPSIQRTILNDLATRVAGGMRHDLPVPYYRELNRRWRRDAL